MLNKIREKKPRLKLLTTGGTIAGAGKNASETADYKAGSLGPQELLKNLPEIGRICDLNVEEICRIDSKNMTESLWIKLANSVNSTFATDEADGVIIAHGTDTMEETAYFLNLTVKYSKPVILTGAMRPSTSYGADGPMNLLQAASVAVSSVSKDHGVLVVMNGEIHASRDVRKISTTSFEAFQSPGFGPLGYVSHITPVFYRKNLRRHTLNSEFGVEGIISLPKVSIVYGHPGDDGVLAKEAIKHDAKGIVYVGMGNGSISDAVTSVLKDAAFSSIPVVRCSRTLKGIVASPQSVRGETSFVDADTLSPQKAKILLQMSLVKTSDVNEIQRIFGEY